VAVFNAEPFVNIKGNGEVTGLNPELLQEIARSEGWTLVFRQGSWSENLTWLEQGEVDLVTTVGKTPERERLFLFSKEPLLTVWSQVFARTKNRYQNILDLQKQQVGLVRQDINGQNFVDLATKFDIQPIIVFFDNHDDMFAALNRQQIDACIAPSQLGMIKRHSFGFVETPIIFSPFTVYFAAARTPEGANFLAVIDGHLAKWKSQPPGSSFFYQRRVHWLGMNLEEVQTRLPRWLVVPVVLILVLGLILIIANKNLTEAKTVASEGFEQSERKFRGVFHHSRQVMAVLDTRGVTLELNHRGTELAGKPLEQLVGLPFWSMPWWQDHPDHQDDVKALILHAVASTTRLSSELPLQDAKKEQHTLAFTFTPILDTKGQVSLIIPEGTDITDIRHSEQRLDSAQKALQKAQEIAHLGSWEWDLASGVMQWSDQLFRMLELAPDSVTPSAELLLQAVPAEEQPRLTPFFLGEADSAFFGNITHHFQTKHQGLRTINHRFERVQSSGSLRLVGTLLDITEFQQTRDKLREIHLRHQLMFEHAGDGILVLRQGVIIEANDRSCSLFGLRKEQIHGCTLLDLLPQGVPQGERLRLELKHAERTATVSQWQFLGNNGTFHAELSLTPFQVKQDWFLLCILRDVSKRVAAERERELLRAAVEHAAESILITDATGVIQYANPTLFATTLYTSEEVVGNTPSMFKSHQHDASHYRQFWEKISRGHLWQGRFINRKKDGSLLIETASVAPIKDAKGEITHYIGIKRDVTEELELQRRLRHSQKMEAIGTMAGGIAHDFNNILSAIFGYLELAYLDLEEKPTLKKDLHEIYNASMRARELVKQILTFARRKENDRQLLLLSPLVKEVSKLIRSSVPAGIHLHLQLKTDGYASVDPTQIHQVLMNLCTNAAHAMAGTGELRILMDQQPFLDGAPPPEESGARDWLVISVSDTGCGIDPSIQSRIFEPYFTTKDPGEGTGLGLAVSHSIISDHGGALRFTSDLGKGSTFRVFLPRMEARVRAEAQAQPIQITTPKSGRLVLLDDEPQITESYAKIFSLAGYQVHECNHPDALFKLDLQTIDLLVCDYAMPGMNGVEVLRRLKQERPELPVLLYSGYWEESVIREAQALGADQILSKPLSVQELKNAIQQMLETPNSKSP
jgi:PAS domain S-box-containing protein